MQEKQRRDNVKTRQRDGLIVEPENKPIASPGDVPSHPAIRDAFQGGLLSRLLNDRNLPFRTLQPAPAGCD